MLEALIASRTSLFQGLAKAWLEEGASYFSVWQNGKMLKSWPKMHIESKAILRAPIKLGEAIVGELHLEGMINKEAQSRLAIEADWVSQLLRLESELETMTVNLIDAQDQLLAMYDLTQSTRSHLEIDQLLRSLARETARILKVGATFTVLQDERVGQIICYHPDAILEEDLVLSLFHQIQKENRPLLKQKSQEVAEISDKIHNLLFVPIQISGEVRAGLGLLNKRYDRFISPDLKLATAIADQVGAQIENVLLHTATLERTKLETQMEMAQRVQHLLIPHTPPQVDGLELAASLQHASQVGGDFFDFIVQPDKPFKFVVGDVSGKGMPAALIMSMTRTVIRTSAKFTPTPEAALSRANMDMYDDFTDVGMFATLFIGAYDHAAREITYANAGHSPVIYCPQNGPAVMLEADGTAMGILPTSLSQNQVIPFHPGDLLIVATDGF